MNSLLLSNLSARTGFSLVKGDVLKLFFWVSFYYIFKKTKAFHFKSKAFLFYSDKFPKNQKLFILNQKLFFFLMTRFLQIKSFSFEIKSFSFSYSKIFRNQKLFFFNQISFFWWFLHYSHTFLTPWHISSPYCAQINYCMHAIITCSWILTIHRRATLNLSQTRPIVLWWA